MTTREEAFDQLKLKFTDPIQHDYEVIRPVVLYAKPVSERSEEIGLDRRRVGEKAQQFILEGMLGLADDRAGKAGRKSHSYPKPVAAHILYLKQLYPPIHYREIVRIIDRKFGYKTNHHTVKNFLERHPIPVQLELKVTYFHDFEDAYRARWTVVRFWAEGWNKRSIAGCLKLSRRHVYEIIKAFQEDGFAGLEDQRSRPFHHPANQLTLPILKDILDIQHEHPRAGRFRVQGLLEKQYQEEGREKPAPSEATVGRAMATNRRFHGAPGPWKSDKKVVETDTEPKYLPYRPQKRHQMWFVDVRYLVQLDEQWVYSLCLIEGYSRTILAGMASEYQDLAAVLQILFAALSEYGAPEMIISDNAKVFYAHHYLNILEALGIEPTYIEKGKPWENLIEAQFKIQLRIADFQFEQAQTFAEIQQQHAQFIDTFNTTRHGAHSDREDGRRTPQDVLSWVRGRRVELEKLRQLFQQVRFARSVNRQGFVSIQRFYIYAERGLSRQRVSIWIYEGTLRLEYQQTLLAQYQCQVDRSHKNLTAVSQPTLFHTPFHSPQLELFELDDEQWLKVYQRPYQIHKKPSKVSATQLSLLNLTASFLVFVALHSPVYCFPYVGGVI